MARKGKSLLDPANHGRKAGKKGRDRHWVDPQGNVWDSRFEYLVYKGYIDAGNSEVRRTTKSDTMAFTLPIKGGKCRDCGATNVGQQRTYTPDLYVAPHNSQREAECYYVEAKGYLRAKERALLRSFYKAHPNLALRIVLQRDYPYGAVSKRTGTRGSISDWFRKFLPNYLISVWKGNPIEFEESESNQKGTPRAKRGKGATKGRVRKGGT